MVEADGVEPSFLRYQHSILTLVLCFNMDARVGLEPTLNRVKVCCVTITLSGKQELSWLSTQHLLPELLCGGS